MSEEAPRGYNGRILRVNLSSKSTTAEAIDELFCRRYIGGAGFITYYLWKELKQGVDALAPDNKLIFALGPISGLQLTGAARHCVGTKSPLTGGLAKAEVGGYWAAELKRAGYDAVIIEGKAEKPVYLFIQDGEASIKDASHLWGLATKETQAAVRAELGDNRVQLAQIGPAGENMVRFACIMHGLYDAAGRGGAGAVMGSKNLKAVAVRGHKLPRVADSERVKEINQRLIATQSPMLSSLSEFGSGGDLTMMEKSGNLPVRNFRDGIFPEVSQIGSRLIKETIGMGMAGCYACPIRCKKAIQFEEPYHCDGAYGGPEYETFAALGSNCGIGNNKAIVKGNERCGAYSMDTISTGGVIAFAMECFEKGLLTTKDTDGIELRFGNDEAMLKVIELIARRQGIGNLLAEGTARMAQKIGKGSADFTMQTKGLEAGYHEPRLRPALGLGYMVSPTGADHGVARDLNNERGMKQLHPLGILEVIPENDIGPRRVALFKVEQFREIIGDVLVVCGWVPYDLTLEAEVLAAVTGWDTSIAELLRVAERVVTVARLFNIREGFSDADDVLPERYYQPKTDGFLADKPLNREKMEKAKSTYYMLMGWDASGVPMPEKVEELYIE
ncbi:aldehyde ferredoxin oxidoreductase family protein [Chloroflexota bacterium]